MFFAFFQISNDYCQKSYNGFRVFLWSSNTSQIFNLHIFDKETVALLNFFEICTGMHFVSLFFLNERNIKTSLLMIHLKCTVVHYSNLNSNSINKPFLNYGPLNMLFLFSDLISIVTFILTRLLIKKLWNNYHFLTQISKIHFNM